MPKVKLKPKNLPKHFWTEESGLTSMLILICISNFIISPFFSQGQVINILVRIIWLSLLFTGITTLAKSGSQKKVLYLIPLLLIIINIIKFLSENLLIPYIDLLIEMAVFVLLIGMVFIKVFENGPITMHRIVGSIVAYMLIGNLWGQWYDFLYFNFPGSIQLPASGLTPTTFLYFSYTTLTTTGYGDILPVFPIARTLAIIEQLIGVLYPVILIGRLVSLKENK